MALFGIDIDLLDKNSQLGAVINAAVTFAVAYYVGPAAGSTLTNLQFATQSSAIAYAATLGTSVLTKALLPQDDIRGGDQGYQITQRGSTMPHQIIYGKTRIAGGIVFQGVTDNNKYLHTVLAFAGHEVEEFETIYLNDEEITLTGNEVTDAGNDNVYGKFYTREGRPAVRIVKKLGTATQTAVTSSDLGGVSPPAKWDVNCRLLTTAYLYVMLEYDADVFPNGVPEITAIVKGK